MNAGRTARERARAELTEEIKAAARRQLATEGAESLSLRAISRELGMVSSALYRYFPSREDLLTALIIDAYDALGTAAESAAAEDYEHPIQAWLSVCAALREWARANPHEYALIYGSPVPGYTAPDTTVPAASRVGLVLLAIIRDAIKGPGMTFPPLSAELRPEAERLSADIAPDLPPAVAAALVAAWAQLFGLIGFELFGQFNRVVEDRDTLFRHAVGQLGRGVGLK